MPDLLRDEVRKIAEDDVEVLKHPQAERKKRLMFEDPDSCFGLNYDDRADKCQVCTMRVSYNDDVFPTNELCEAVREMALQRLLDSGHHVCEQCDDGDPSVFETEAELADHLEEVHGEEAVEKEIPNKRCESAGCTDRRMTSIGLDLHDALVHT